MSSEPAAGLLSNSNRSPVVCESSVQLAKILERPSNIYIMYVLYIFVYRSVYIHVYIMYV